MLRALGLIAWAYLAAALQTTLAPTAELWAVTPDLLLVSAAAWVCLGPLDISGPRGAAAFGLAGDLISPGPLGFGLVTGFALGLAVLWARQKLESDSLPLRLALAAAFVAATSAAMALFYVFTGHLTLAPTLALARTLGAGTYTLTLALAVILAWSLPSSLVPRP